MFLAVLGMLPCLSHGNDCEMPAPRTVDEAVSSELRTSEHYRIEEPVQHDGYMHTYTVATDCGIFLARGDAMLRRLLRELTAIADLRQRYATGVAAESALQVLIEPVQTVGRLATEPKTRWSEFALSEDEALFYQEAAAEMLGGVQ